jgi:hypothetical protein
MSPLTFSPKEYEFYCKNCKKPYDTKVYGALRGVRYFKQFEVDEKGNLIKE